MAQHPSLVDYGRHAIQGSLSSEERTARATREAARTGTQLIGITLLAGTLLLGATAFAQPTLQLGDRPFDSSAIDACALGVSFDGCFSVAEAFEANVTNYESLLRSVGVSLDAIDLQFDPADQTRLFSAFSTALEDPTTRLSFVPGGEYMCVFNQVLNDALVGSPQLASFFAHDGCTTGDGTGFGAISVPLGSSGTARPELTGTLGAPIYVPSGPAMPEPSGTQPTTPATPGRVTADDAAPFWGLASQDVIDAHARAVTAAQTERWRIDNEVLETSVELGHEAARYRNRLADWWSSPDVIAHNRSALEQQQQAARALYWITLGLVVAGIVLTIVQFTIAMITSLRVKRDLPALAVARASMARIEDAEQHQPDEHDTSAAKVHGAPAVTVHDHMRLVDTEFKFELEKIGFSVKTSIVGVVLLLTSFAFMFLYMRYAFPLSFPQAPALESTVAPSGD